MPAYWLTVVHPTRDLHAIHACLTRAGLAVKTGAQAFDDGTLDRPPAAAGPFCPHLVVRVESPLGAGMIERALGRVYRQAALIHAPCGYAAAGNK